MSTKELYRRIQRFYGFQPKMTSRFHRLMHTISNKENCALKVQTLLKNKANKLVSDIFQSLSNCNFTLSEDFILNFLKRNHSNWKSTFIFFKWILAGENPFRYSPNTESFNEILDILGCMRCLMNSTKCLTKCVREGIWLMKKLMVFD